MLIVHAAIKLKPGVRDEAIPACLDHARHGLHEPGCSLYLFTQDLDDPDTLHVLEQFDSNELMEAHMHNARSEAFAKRMTGWAQGVQVSRYSIAEDQSKDFQRESQTLMGDTVKS